MVVAVTLVWAIIVGWLSEKAERPSGVTVIKEAKGRKDLSNMSYQELSEEYYSTLKRLRESKPFTENIQ